VELVEKGELKPELCLSNEPWTISKPFFFGFQKEPSVKPKLKSGTSNLPFPLAFTSLVLLLNTIRLLLGLSTYKLNLNRFPLMRFSVSDMSGHFHLVLFALVSQEKQEDFVWFFQTLIYLYSLFGIELKAKVQVVMMDACEACYLAVRQCVPDAKILMCFFHVKCVSSIFSVLNFSV
jgi:hypothetical protein